MNLTTAVHSRLFFVIYKLYATKAINYKHYNSAALVFLTSMLTNHSAKSRMESIFWFEWQAPPTSCHHENMLTHD